MSNEFDDGRAYTAGIVWQKARKFYANVGLRCRYTAAELLSTPAPRATWDNVFLVQARLRAEIEDLSAEVKVREQQLRQLDSIRERAPQR